MSMLREFMPVVLVIDRDLLWGGAEAVLELMAERVDLAKVAIILTGDGRVDEEVLARSSLPVAYLAKPYRLGELLALVAGARRLKPALFSPAESL